MSVKITALEAENVKRIKAVALTPAPTGLTLVGGNNNQGKTSVLDALAWALGGEKFRPNAAQRDGAVAPAHLRVTLSNGVVVERKGKNSSLPVPAPPGRRSGQQLLNAFVEPLALDLPRFMEASDKEKADILLRIIGIGNELHDPPALLARRRPGVQRDRREVLGRHLRRVRAGGGAGMTYEEKISWLSRYREAEKLYQRLSYRLAEAQEATRHITQNLSAAPGGSKDGQSLARAVEREEEAERRAYAQLAVLDALFAEIDAVLVQLDSAEYCALRKCRISSVAA